MSSLIITSILSELLIKSADFIFKENYGKRPLSKMVTDISKEIGLVGEEG